MNGIYTLFIVLYLIHTSRDQILNNNKCGLQRNFLHLGIRSKTHCSVSLKKLSGLSNRLHHPVRMSVGFGVQGDHLEMTRKQFLNEIIGAVRTLAKCWLLHPWADQGLRGLFQLSGISKYMDSKYELPAVFLIIFVHPKRKKIFSGTNIQLTLPTSVKTSG